MKVKIKDFLNESNWTQGQFARDEDGNSCAAIDARAKKFCLMGAAYKCFSNETEMILDLLNRELQGDAIGWNDAPGRTFEEVKAVIEKLDI